MKYTTFVSTQEDVLACAEAPGVEEVLIEPEAYSVAGSLYREQVEELALAAREKGLRAVFVWDALMTQAEFSKRASKLRLWNLNSFSAIRVQDLGAAHWVMEHAPDCALQLIAERGNNNVEALRGWSEHLGEKLSRLVLSPELTEEEISRLCRELRVPCEILGAGRIEMFYSHRPLVSASFKKDSPRELGRGRLEALACSEDSHNRFFPVLETPAGTMMYLDKDQFILDRLDGLIEAGLHTVRLDLRHLSVNGSAAEWIDVICRGAETEPAKLKEIWPRETAAPFFKTNKTTAQFPKLRSELSSLRDENYLAEIVGIDNGHYVAFFTRREFRPGDILEIRHRSGETSECEDLEFKNLSGEVLTQVPAESICVTPWIKGVSTGALLRKKI